MNKASQIESYHEVSIVSGQPRHWKHMPKLGKVPPGDNYTGQQFGQFTVVGVPTFGSERWIVQCSCGDFELRHTNAIEAAANHDCCQECQSRRSIARGSKRKSKNNKQFG